MSRKLVLSDTSSETEQDGDTMPTSLTAIDLDGITTTSLEALQGDGQRKILDIVDDLRRQGLSGIVELPQLVVCGDQSSGMSPHFSVCFLTNWPQAKALSSKHLPKLLFRAMKICVPVSPPRLSCAGMHVRPSPHVLHPTRHALKANKRRYKSSAEL
jgi:hypothetical protein